MNKSLSGLNTFLLNLVSHLPFWLLYLLADLLFFILFYLIKYRRKVTQTNLRNAFPEKADDERSKIEKQYYRFLADMILESVKMSTISEAEVRKRCQLVNPDEVQQHYDKGRSVLLASGHYANWEWANLALALGFKEKLLVIFKPLTNKSFEENLNRLRSRFGATMVSMKQTLRKIVELKNERYMFGFASDQTPTRHESQYFTRFLNQDTAVFLGLEKISKTTGQPVVFLHIDRLKRGFYEYTFTTLVEDPSTSLEYEITNLHTQKLEQIIRQKPELWLWSHKRWKFTPEEINQ
ncbi:lysophospholipid acyltransferase family protein [Flavihumibacter sp. R14]|nr:lysophospholipid acyltransferase family protein [Flavihumibacter soli]